jgi:Putative phage integrase
MTATFIASAKYNDVWINDDLCRFAIVPDAEGQDISATAEAVHLIVAAYRAAGDSKEESVEKTELLAELYDLHAQGRVLWPVGVPWDQSVLGEVSGHRFGQLMSQADQHCLALRDEIESSPTFANHRTTPIIKRTMGFYIWRMFMTARLSTIGLEDLCEFDEGHLGNMLLPLQGEGSWARWLDEQHRRAINRFVRFMAEFHDQPLFGARYLNPMRFRAGRTSLVLENWPHLTWLLDAINEWAERLPTMTKSAGDTVGGLLISFAKTLPPELAKTDRLFSRETKTALLQYASEFSTPRQRGLALSRVLDFAEWYVEDYASHRGIKLGLTRYDVEQFLKQIPPSPSRPADVLARPMPVRFHHMLKQIITENDFAWPKSIKHRVTGNPLHWFEWTSPQTGRSEPVFCEVLPRMLCLHLDLPLRNIQVRRLDSGEGDDRVYSPETHRWTDSTGQHAGYWCRLGAKNSRRGVFREISTQTGAITGFWINSNKTQDAGNLFDETSGYEIPWQHDEVLENLTAMRRWQEKYNPVAEAIAYEDIPHNVFDDTPSKLVLSVLPARFYLFRYPLNKGARGKEAPPTYDAFSQFFYEALDELERRLHEEQPGDAIRIITARAADGRPMKAIFSIHGMRSSTLTTLHLAGVPIEILSKLLAGHATILMTLRYTKFDPAHVNEVLNNARTQALAAGRTQFANMLRSATIEHAMRMSARLSDDGLHQAKGQYDEPTGWVRTDIGICPNGGTQCHIGGRAFHKRREKHGTEKSTHGPVSGGPRNCVRCRFFVTGLPFLPPLWIHATAILAKVDGLSKRIAQTQEEVADLKKRIRDGVASFPDKERKEMLEEAWMTDSEIRDQALADFHAAMFLIEKIRVIGKSGDAEDDAKLPMLFDQDGVPEVTGRESTRFELADAVVQGSRWYPSINTTELERERDEFLNRILFNSGYVPITLAPLSVEERRRAADALAQLVLAELGAAEAEHLIEGRKTLADFGLQERLEKAAASAIGRPIEKLAMSAPRPPILIEAAAE